MLGSGAQEITSKQVGSYTRKHILLYFLHLVLTFNYHPHPSMLHHNDKRSIKAAYTYSTQTAVLTFQLCGILGITFLVVLYGDPFLRCW